MDKQTIVERIKFWAKTEPDVPAFIFWGAAGRRVLTRTEVYDLASRYAFQLKENGVKPGDVVCVVLPNSPERIVVDFGVQLVGAVAINGWRLYDSAGEDLICPLMKSKCTTIILNYEKPCDVLNIIRNGATKCDEKGDYVAVEDTRIPTLQRVLRFHKDKFLDRLLSNESHVFENRKFEDVAVIFPTSGGAANSKLVPYTHEMIARIGSSRSKRSYTTGEKFFNCSLFGWLGGFPIPYLWTGTTRLAIDDLSGDIPDKWALMWKMIVTEKATAASMTPTVASALSKKRLRSNMNHSLKLAVTGGQPVRKPTIQFFRDIADHIMVVYAMTEMGYVSSHVFKAEELENFEDFMAGQVSSSMEVKIVDENTQPVPVNTRGEILIRSQYAPSGYLSDDEATKKAFLSNGWFRSGDAGYMRDDGRLFVEGRSANVIMHGLFIIYPTWLETRLADCPGVKEVVVVPVPDKLLHHEICACIIRDKAFKNEITQNDVIMFGQKQFLLELTGSPSVAPKYVLFFDEFPLTLSNKVNRSELTLEATKLLNLA